MHLSKQVEPGCVCIIWWYPDMLTAVLKKSVMIRTDLLIEEGVDRSEYCWRNYLSKETTERISKYITFYCYFHVQIAM